MNAKRLILLVCAFLFLTIGKQLNAQVSIGGDTPQVPESFSILELISPKTGGSGNVGGLRLPQLTEADKTTIEPSLLGNAEKSKGLFIYNTDKDSIQYWDGTQWITPGAASGASASSGVTLPWQVSGTTETDNNTLNVNDNVYHLGSVSIGSSATPDPSAILNVQSSNKGVLLPQVTLTSSTDQTTILNPAEGLLVYNTGTDMNFAVSGYMYWTGTEWRLFENMTADPASATINCNGSTMNPGQQITNGLPIITGTVLQVPYTLSNGGGFNGITLKSTGNNGVTATIAPGILAIGAGVLNFVISGTPTLDQQAPNGITFNLQPFLDANPGITGCNSVTVGNLLSASIASTAVMGYLMATSENDGGVSTSGYALQCNSPDGKWSVRARCLDASIGHGDATLNVELRNNLSTDQFIIWNYETQYGGNVGNAGTLNVPAQRWGGDNDSGTTWTNISNSNVGYWGNVGIYDANNNGPEYRRYTWIPIGSDNKVSYEANIMTAIDTATPGTAVPFSQVKVYVKFEQVTAQ